MCNVVLFSGAQVCWLLQIFPRSERNFTSESICNWVFEHHEDILQWLQPPGTKSRLLERELNKGPALLLFLTHNPLGSSSNPVLQQVNRAGVIPSTHTSPHRLLWGAPGFRLRSSDIFHLYSVGHFSRIPVCPMKVLVSITCLFSPFRLETLLFGIIPVTTMAPARMEV